VVILSYRSFGYPGLTRLSFSLYSEHFPTLQATVLQGQERPMGRTTSRLRKRVKRPIRRARNRFDHRPVAHFMHIGKTGGTALRFALHDARNATAYRVIRHGHRARLRDIPPGEKFFFSVRDPIDRYVSAFSSRQREGRPRHYRPWTEGEAAAFSRFDSPESLAVALSDEAEGSRSAAEDAMHAIQHLNSSYWKWFADPGYFRSRVDDLLWIGRQEALELERLSQALGVDHLRMPDDPLTANRSTGPKPELSAVARRNLRRFYGRDYEFLDLCHELFPPVARHPEA
jgi:hypothetical protein